MMKKIRKFGNVQDMKFPNGEDSTDTGKVCLLVKYIIFR
jgi:hypothetical protein